MSQAATMNQTRNLDVWGRKRLKVTLVGEGGDEIHTLLDVPVTDELPDQVSDGSIGPATAKPEPGSVAKDIIWDEVEKSYPESNLYDPDCWTDPEVEKAIRLYLKRRESRHDEHDH